MMRALLRLLFGRPRASTPVDGLAVPVFDREGYRPEMLGCPRLLACR